MWNKNFFLQSAIYYLLLCFINCSSSIPHNLNIKIESESEFFDIVKSRSVTSIDAVARMELYKKGKARKGKVYVTVRAPDSILLQINSPSEDVISTFISHESKVSYYDRNLRKCYHGMICPSNIMKLTNLELDAMEVAMMLMGQAPSENMTIDGIYTNSDGQVFKVSGKRDLYTTGGQAVGQASCLSSHLSMWFKGKNRLLFHIEAQDIEKSRYSVDFDDFKLLQEKFLFPHTIKFNSHLDSTELYIKYREVSINNKIDGEIFEFKCPEGFENVELSCE